MSTQSIKLSHAISELSEGAKYYPGLVLAVLIVMLFGSEAKELIEAMHKYIGYTAVPLFCVLALGASALTAAMKQPSSELRRYVVKHAELAAGIGTLGTFIAFAGVANTSADLKVLMGTAVISTVVGFAGRLLLIYLLPNEGEVLGGC